MFNSLFLFIMLLTPVIAYVAGAVIFSVIKYLRKDSRLTPGLSKYNNLISYRNGL